jgi:hypothetical protein
MWFYSSIFKYEVRSITEETPINNDYNSIRIQKLIWHFYNTKQED